jgi:N-acyl-L-homoserine lactone synthetase
MTPLDELAARLVARAAPVSLRCAGSEREREAAFRLRYDAIVERRWADAAAFPDHSERDEFDRDAVHVLAWLGGRAVGTARLVFPAGGRLLPTEAAFDLELEPRGAVVNLDRMTVARSHSDPAHRVYAALLGRSWLELRERGFSELCGIHTRGMIRLCRQLGLVMEVVGPPRRHWREKRFPIRFDTQATVALLAARAARGTADSRPGGDPRPVSGALDT